MIAETWSVDERPAQRVLTDLERLEAEIASLANTARLAADFEQKALAAHDQAETALGVAETRLSELTTAAAEARARRQSLETQKRERLDRVAKLERQLMLVGQGHYFELWDHGQWTAKLAQATGQPGVPLPPGMENFSL